MKKVYILNDTGHDVTDAKQYGELVFVSDTKYPIFNPSEIILRLKTVLKVFNSSCDYLVMSGSPFVASLALSYLLTIGCEKVNVLLFDAKARVYVPRTITVGQLGG